MLGVGRRAIFLRSNVRANRTPAVGWLGPGWRKCTAYRQAGPRQPAVGGPVVQRGVRPRSLALRSGWGVWLPKLELKCWKLWSSRGDDEHTGERGLAELDGPQAGPRQPAVVGPVVQRGVMPHPTEAREVGYFCRRSTEATPSRLMAEQGRYSAAAGNETNQRLAARGATSQSDLRFWGLTGPVWTS